MMDVGAFRSNNDRKEQTERPIHMVPAVFSLLRQYIRCKQNISLYQASLYSTDNETKKIIESARNFINKS